MKKFLMTLLFALSCNAIEGEERACGADEIEDILGVWYKTTTRPGVQPGYFTSDSMVWMLSRIPGKFGSNFTDSLQIIIEFHPGDAPFDPTRHRQDIYRLGWLSGSSPLHYGEATFDTQVCDTLEVIWIDGKYYTLSRGY